MIARVSGVLLDADDAAYAVKALDLLVRLLSTRGSAATPRLRAFTAELARKTQAASSVSLAVPGSCAPERSDHADDERHALIGTAAAAAILGITPSAVRQLAARGTLGSVRPAGRWQHPTAAVVERAERKAQPHNDTDGRRGG